MAGSNINRLASGGSSDFVMPVLIIPELADTLVKRIPEMVQWRQQLQANIQQWQQSMQQQINKINSKPAPQVVDKPPGAQQV